jgi:hypothetical protein
VALQKSAKVAKSRQPDPRAILGRKLVASHGVQHPPRDGDLYPVGQADHNDVGMSPPQRTNDVNRGAKERMVAVRNP